MKVFVGDHAFNDARLMATTLQSAGFQLIGGEAQVDLDRAGFERAIRDFGTALANASAGLFYYAGHGLQLQGVNYLVPVTANPETAAEVDLQLINASTVLRDAVTRLGTKHRDIGRLQEQPVRRSRSARRQQRSC
jgi:uncharacterized caspase-like protein